MPSPASRVRFVASRTASSRVWLRSSCAAPAAISSIEPSATAANFSTSAVTEGIRRRSSPRRRGPLLPISGSMTAPRVACDAFGAGLRIDAAHCARVRSRASPPLASAHGRRPAAPRPPLRPRRRRLARRGLLAAVRRDRPRAARGARRPLAVQRRRDRPARSRPSPAATPTPTPPSCSIAWRAAGAVVRDDEPALWALTQEYTGPDGAARTRNGLPRARPRRGLRPRPHPPARAHASRARRRTACG